MYIYIYRERERERERAEIQEVITLPMTAQGDSRT